MAAEIVEAEGPIHLDRVAQLTAASFGVGRLHANRAAKINRQVKAAGLTVDKAKFVWSEGVDPGNWNEFRPNTSHVDRPFLFMSPAEIANVMGFLVKQKPGLSSANLDSATLRTFGPDLHRFGTIRRNPRLSHLVEPLFKGRHGALTNVQIGHAKSRHPPSSRVATRLHSALGASEGQLNGATQAQETSHTAAPRRAYSRRSGEARTHYGHRPLRHQGR